MPEGDDWINCTQSYKAATIMDNNQVETLISSGIPRQTEMLIF
jgi:hypothetical protein